jgi:cohesin loading factor subunit SCC2
MSVVTDVRFPGYRMPGPTALLHPWYSLVREKRAARQDFLRATLKAFEIDADFATRADDAAFVRYMAENAAALEYKTQEEVLTVVKHLIKVLSTVGMQLVEALSPSDLLAQLHDEDAMETEVRVAFPMSVFSMKV